MYHVLEVLLTIPRWIVQKHKIMDIIHNGLSESVTEISITLIPFWPYLASTFRFGRCEICYQLSRALSDGKRSMEEKLADVKAYRDHLHSQFVDRSIQWSLNELSQDHTSGTLMVLVDGLDQAKFRLPRHPGLRPVSSMNLSWKLAYWSWCWFWQW